MALLSLLTLLTYLCLAPCICYAQCHSTLSSFVLPPWSQFSKWLQIFAWFLDVVNKTSLEAFSHAFILSVCNLKKCQFLSGALWWPITVELFLLRLLIYELTDEWSNDLSLFLENLNTTFDYSLVPSLSLEMNFFLILVKITKN